MNMSKSPENGLKARECERTKLREPPPVPYVPVRDEVQDEVAKLRNMEIKTTLEKDTTLNFPVWQENGTREGFLMHVQAVLDAIKKGVILMTMKKPRTSSRTPRKPSCRPGLVYRCWRIT
jgi:hypothetical protein